MSFWSGAVSFLIWMWGKKEGLLLWWDYSRVSSTFRMAGGHLQRFNPVIFLVREKFRQANILTVRFGWSCGPEFRLHCVSRFVIEYTTAWRPPLQAQSYIRAVRLWVPQVCVWRINHTRRIKDEASLWPDETVGGWDNSCLVVVFLKCPTLVLAVYMQLDLRFGAEQQPKMAANKRRAMKTVQNDPITTSPARAQSSVRMQLFKFSRTGEAACVEGDMLARPCWN